MEICVTIQHNQSEAFIVRYLYSQKEELISFVFYCLESPSIAHNFGTTGLIQVGFKQNVLLQMSTSIKQETENVTCPTSD